MSSLTSRLKIGSESLLGGGEGHSLSAGCPLFLVLHGNNPTIWKKQQGSLSRWELPRIPFLRCRPATSIIRDQEPLLIPCDSEIYFGAELGVVLKKDAKNVAETEVSEYVAGYTCVNDLSSSLYNSYYGAVTSPYERHTLSTLAKAIDGCGGIGPKLKPIADISDPYELLTYTYCGGKFMDRAHTGSYLCRIEYLIAYLSRFMTLPAGTVISMGAAGWDGIKADFVKAPDQSVNLEVEIESVGRLKNRLCTGPPSEDFRQSPFLQLQKKRGDSFPFRNRASFPKSLWVLRGNYRNCPAVEGIPEPNHICPHLFPVQSIGNPKRPVVIPPHATTLHCTCQLAGVIGPEPVYRVSREKAAQYFIGYAPVLSFQDTSLIEPVRFPACYEERAAYFLGGCGDGFYQIGEIIPRTKASKIGKRSMRVIRGKDKVETNTGDYRYGLDEMLSLLSQGITILPGDILSLGPAGERLVISETDRRDCQISASVDGLGGVEVSMRDLREPDKKDREFR